MLETSIGNIRILMNGQILDFQPINLPNRGKNFLVDGRYQIVVDNISVNNDMSLIAF
jgi:hypothetical protein